MILETVKSLLQEGWDDVFPQKRTLNRGIEHAIASLCGLGRRSISRTICAIGRQQQDWSADYKLFSRSSWDVDELFNPVFDSYMSYYQTGPITVAFDDTKIKKTGRKVKTAAWQRDPMSPPFHTNFIYGLRFIQASMIFPHYQDGDHDPRGIPVRFTEAPPLKKPGKKASDEEKQDYRKAKKEINLSTQTLDVVRSVRKTLDEYDGDNRLLICALDGSFCNRTFFRADLTHTVLVARCRKDACLCKPAAPVGRRKYDPDTFTPEEVRKDDRIVWGIVNIRVGGKKRMIRYKEVNNILWRRGAGQTKLRLIVIAPTPYKLSPNSKINYRDPAYLLVTDTKLSSKRLVQAYVDRWQIEVNHREEKNILGVGDAQVWADKSVPRHPAFRVACYSMALLAALKAFGPARTSDYLPLPKWRSFARRPSILDIISLIRMDLIEARVSIPCLADSAKNLLLTAFT